jgi:hypothetical protein
MHHTLDDLADSRLKDAVIECEIKGACLNEHLIGEGLLARVLGGPKLKQTLRNDLIVAPEAANVTFLPVSLTIPVA